MKRCRKANGELFYLFWRSDNVNQPDVSGMNIHGKIRTGLFQQAPVTRLKKGLGKRFGNCNQIDVLQCVDPLNWFLLLGVDIHKQLYTSERTVLADLAKKQLHGAKWTASFSKDAKTGRISVSNDRVLKERHWRLMSDSCLSMKSRTLNLFFPSPDYPRLACM